MFGAAPHKVSDSIKGPQLATETLSAFAAENLELAPQTTINMILNIISSFAWIQTIILNPNNNYSVAGRVDLRDFILLRCQFMVANYC